MVQLFQDHHGEEDVVLLEAEDGGRVVHQHIGVEDEEAGPIVFALDHGGAVRSAAPLAAWLIRSAWHGPATQDWKTQGQAPGWTRPRPGGRRFPRRQDAAV
jgi:hypothetical protein